MCCSRRKRSSWCWISSSNGFSRSAVRQNTELVAALRQCDGEHLQAIVIVRDEFWMAATSFFDDLEAELILRQNAVAVDLFDPHHARRVLRAFGTAYGILPVRPADFSREQHASWMRLSPTLPRTARSSPYGWPSSRK